jgi:hypothetical protein
MYDLSASHVVAGRLNSTWNCLMCMVGLSVTAEVWNCCHNKSQVNHRNGFCHLYEEF